VTVTVRHLTAGSTRTIDSERGEDALFLHVVRSGALVHQLAGATVERAMYPAPTALAVRSKERQVLGAAHDAVVLSLRLPADVTAGIQLPEAPVFRIDTKGALYAPFVDFAVRSASQPEVEPSTFSAYYFERLLQEMVIGVLVDSARARAVPRSTETFTLAVSIVTAQLADQSLTAASVAHELNTSLRQLQRHFRSRGTTVEREIRRLRVEHAASLLVDRSYDGLTVDQVAQFSGFASGSSLARAMAAEGLASPAKLRREARTSGERPRDVISDT
jgi:AraC-like DNA-binding protein